MGDRQAVRLTLAATLVVAAMTGCASPSSPATPTGSTSDAAECGTFAFMTWEPGGGEASRREVLEGMLRGHERLRESPGPADERSTPEDVILTIEAALNSLLRVEANASPTSLVVVPAVSDDGVQLGQFVIDWDGESYIITEYSIDHVAGEPCAAS